MQRITFLLALLLALATHPAQAIQYGVAVNNARLDAIETAIGLAPILEIWTGSKPANCAAASTGTKIAVGTLPSDWLSPASGAAKSKLGSWTVLGQTAAGAGGLNAGYFRITVSGTCHIQGTLAASGGGTDMTMDSILIHDGDIVTVNSFNLNAGNQ
jgi:hypothetical protein